MQLFIGADPEVFLWNKDEKKYESAHEIIPGTKDKPFKVKKGAVQVDGTALEFNIDPASSVNEFTDNIDTVLDQCKEMLPRWLEMKFVPSVKFDEKYYDKLPKSCKILGCDPDYDAVSGRTNPPPRPNGTLRTAGGHIHLGWTADADVTDRNHIYDCRQMVMRLDTYFKQFKQFYDKDTVRGQLYGATAAFRPKPYGVEYRSLSNAWLDNRKLWPWVFDSAQWIFKHALSGEKFDIYHIPDEYWRKKLKGLENAEYLVGNYFYDHRYPKLPV